MLLAVKEIWNPETCACFTTENAAVIIAGSKIGMAVSYTHLLLAVYDSCAALYRSMGNAQITLKISLLMNVINVVGNAIGVYVLKLGVAGVAIPSRCV